MDDRLGFARAALIEIRNDRNQLRRRVYDYISDGVVLTQMDWDIDPWDQFLWGP